MLRWLRDLWPTAFDIETFVRMLRLTAARRPLTRRRAFLLSLVGGLFPPLHLLDASFSRLDHLLYGAFQRVSIERPVFMVGIPRTGTTFLHRLLCLDEERYAYFTMAEIICAPLSLRRVVSTIGALDRRFLDGRIRSRCFEWNERALAAIDHMHKIRLDEPDEDGWLLAHLFSTSYLFTLFPFMEAFPELAVMDAMPRRKRERLLDYYEAMLKRQLFVKGERRTILSKNPTFTTFLLSLNERFPDARFIYSVRAPHEAIASLVSMFHTIWQAHSPEIPKNSPESQALARLLIGMYRYMEEKGRGMPRERFYTVNYPDLVRDPQETVEGIYAHFGWEMTEPFRSRLSEERERARGYKSRHRYDLEEYGIDPRELYASLEDVYERYGYAPPRGAERGGRRNGAETAGP